MKGDRELCTAAVAQNKYAFNHVPRDLKTDKAIMLADFQQTYKFTPADMESNKTIMLAAIRQSPGENGAYSWISDTDLATNRRIRKAVGVQWMRRTAWPARECSK